MIVSLFGLIAIAILSNSLEAASSLGDTTREITLETFRRIKTINPAIAGMIRRHHAQQNEFIGSKILSSILKVPDSGNQIALARHILYSHEHSSLGKPMEEISKIDSLGSFFGAINSSLSVHAPSSICVAAKVEDCLTYPRRVICSPESRSSFSHGSSRDTALEPIELAFSTSLNYRLAGSVLSDRKIPDSIDRLVSLGIPVIGISSILAGERITLSALEKLSIINSDFINAHQIESIKQIFTEFGKDQSHIHKAREITELGLRFCGPISLKRDITFSDYPKFCGSHPIYYDGLLFPQEYWNYGSSSKGELLNSLFEEGRFDPTTIFYLSNSMEDILRFQLFFGYKNNFRKQMGIKPTRIVPFLFMPKSETIIAKSERDEYIAPYFKEIGDIVSERA
jgi:hypothetical protein